MWQVERNETLPTPTQNLITGAKTYTCYNCSVPQSNGLKTSNLSAIAVAALPFCCCAAPLDLPSALPNHLCCLCPSCGS